MNSSITNRTPAKPQSYPPAIDEYKSTAPHKIGQKKPSRLVQALAHEVRNPLTNINLAAVLLEASLMSNEQKTFLEIIKRSSARINNLINELLKYQQAEDVIPEKYSINQLLDEALHLAEDRIALKNITVSKDYASKDFKIVFNKSKMKIGLSNIIINAIDAMGTEKGQLKLVTKSIRGRYIIRIEDNGCGISKQNLKYIFKPYYSGKPGGIGIGLAATYEILRSNHIGINVESEEGSGTRFILLFDKNHHRTRVVRL